ncbi:adenomatous polyposis coli protein-like isoform X2 [Haliotis asinina]|uniref:adenomatous polyposis coli protein-like isoform X2 n=1 Tax=Haliotis asinina TaxID=109174 RepID=UPI00353265BC
MEAVSTRHNTDLSTDDLGERDDNESWADAVDNVTCLKSEVNSPNGHFTHAEHEIYAQLHNLDLERNALMREIQTEDSLRERFFQQLEILSQKLESLPLSETYNLQTDMTRRQVEYEAKKLEEAMTEKFGTSEHIAQRQEARLQRIRNIEAEMMMLQQRHREQQLLKQQQLSLDRGLNPGCVKDVATNTALCGEIFVPKPGIDNARTSDKSVFGLTHGSVMISIATQTSDVIIQENPDILQANISQNNTLSSIYHGSWPIGKELPNGEEGVIPDLRGHDLASVMSFNSTNTSSTNSSAAAPSDDRTEQHPHQQLGTKVEMVYSLLSMLGTHDKDDMSRTLLAMSSSQDSCIAMRQSGCLPLLIQLLHGSDKDSGLLGNTRGSKAARARASAALHNIVHSHPDDKRGRREARVLRLLEQIRAHCDQLRGDNSEEEDEPKNNKPGSGAARASDIDHHPGPAIAALMKLSFDEEHRHAICTLGGLQAIAELLEVDHDAHGPTTEQYNITMRRYACMALTNLTFGDGTNKALLCSMKGAMEGLVAQLGSPNEDLCQVAASVLRNLSWRADLASKKTLREVNAVTTLMAAAMQVKKESTLKSILSALWNLSAHCTENKADICAVSGALEFLVSMLTYKSPSKTLAIIENGGGILRNVSSHIAVREDYRKVLRQHSCLQLLLKHLRSTSLTIVSNACGTLWNLSARCQEDQQALWEMGAVSMLRNLVHSKHKMISMGSAAALKNLLSARPAMKNLDLDRISGSNRPGLHARKVRALEQELDENLAETCENVESPRNSPTETKKENTYTRRYSGDNVVVFPVADTEPRRPMMRGHMFPRSGSTDSAGVDGKLRSPQRVARSGSQDSVGSTHSDISHDRSRAHTMLAKSSRLLHERQAGSLERKRDGGLHRFNSDGGAVDRTRVGGAPNSRILQVMQEVAMHAGLPANSTAEPESQQSPRNVRALAYQSAQIKAGNFNGPQRSLIEQFGKKPFNYLPNAKEMYVGPKRNNVDVGDTGAEGDEQPINYSLKYQDVGAGSSRDQLNNRPQVKVGNFVGSTMVPRAMPNMVHNRFPAPNNTRNVYEPRHRNVGAHQGIPTQYGAYAETDIDMDDQPTNFSLRYAENVEETFQDQPINYSVRYQEADPSQRYHQAENNGRYQEADPSQRYHQPENNSRYQEADPSQRYHQPENNGRYQEADPSQRYHPPENNVRYQEAETDSSPPYEESDPHCADCKLEEARRTNERLDEYMPSFFTDDQVKTFCTEGTPYLSTATSLTDLTGKIQYKEEAEPKKECEEAEDETKDYSNTFEETNCVSNPAETGSTVVAGDTSSANPDGGDAADGILEQSFHSPTSRDVPIDQPKTYCEEGTPVCFSRVSSLSSLHSSEARDLPESHGGRHHLVLSSIEESEKGEAMSASVIENSEARKTIKTSGAVSSATPGTTGSATPGTAGSTTPGTAEVVEKEHKTVTFDDHHHVEETPLMFSRCSSLGSLSSFDTQSVHSSVISEYSRRASEVVSPSELPDSPSETMPTSPKPEPQDEKAGLEQKPEDFTEAIVCDSDVAQPVSSLAALIAADNLSVVSKMEAPVVYADEGTPPTMSDTHSMLSALTIDDEAVGKKTDLNQDDSTSEDTKASNHLNEENSSMSEVSEGEEDILAQCINSAMPVPNNSSRKMRKSSSDNAIKKKTGVPKIDNLGSATKSKLPTKVTNITAQASKSPTAVNKLPRKDPKSPGGKLSPPGKTVPLTPSKFEDRKSGSRIAQSTTKSSLTSHLAQTATRSPQTPRGGPNRGPQTPRGTQNNRLPQTIQTGGPRSVGPQARPQLTPNKAPVVPAVSTPHQLQYVSDAQQQSTPRQLSHVDMDSYSPDFNSDTVKTYATEGTPLNFSNANSVSDLSSLSFDDTSIKQSPAPAVEDVTSDITSDNSSLCEETEELLVSQVIQAAMPKSKVARRLDMDRQAEGAEDSNRKPASQIVPHIKYSPPSSSSKIPAAQVAPVRQLLGAPATFQPQRTSSVATQPQVTSKSCEVADTVKSYAVEGTPLNFSNATSLSDLTIDSVDDTARFRVSDTHKISNMTSASQGQIDDSVFYGGDSVDSPQVYQVEGTPLIFSRNDSLSELSMLSGDLQGLVEKHDEVSDTVSSSSSSIPKERHVVGQSSEESSVIVDHTKDSEDNCKRYAMEDTPMCFSRNSSLSSLHSPEPNKPTSDTTVITDQRVPFKVEDTPTVFSRNSSLSELSIESTAFDPTPSEQALLDECISSAMPKSRISRGEEKFRRSIGGKGKSDKKLSKSTSLEIRSDDSIDEGVFKKPGSKTMSYSCSDAGEIQRVSQSSSTQESLANSWHTQSSQHNSRFGWKRSHSQDSEYFIKAKKDSSNSEIAKMNRPFRGSADTVEETTVSYDNRMLEEARALREKLLTASCDSAVTDSMTEKIDSEKSHLNDSFIMKMALTQSQGSCDDVMDTSFPQDPNTEDDGIIDDSEVSGNEADTTVVRNVLADETIVSNRDTSSSFEEEISPEDILLLEENASLIVSELSTNQMSGSVCDDDMFIENETMSLVSNDYTSDTASEVSVSWSNTSEKVSEYSGSTISQTEGSVASQKRPKIVKPDKENMNRTPPKANTAAVRGRRKPLYTNSSRSSTSSVRSTSTTRSEVSTHSARPVTTSRSTAAKPQNQTTGLKKVSPRSQTQGPSASSTPNKTAANRRQSRSPAAANRSNSSSSIPRSPLAKTSPQSKIQSTKDNTAKTKTDRPKPLIKQGTFTKDTASVSAPTIDMDHNANKTNSESVKIREKKASQPQNQRNSGGSNRNSGGSQNEAWSKALDSFNFMVDNPQENGYDARYKQIQMQRNGNEGSCSVKRPANTSLAGKKPSNLARPVQGQTTPPRSNSKSNLNKSGSGGNLRKTSSGTSLTKTQSGSSLCKTSSGSSLNRGGSASNLKRLESKSELKKSDSNASLKTNSRPTTPVGRRPSNTSVGGRKSEGASPNKTFSAGGDKKVATPTSDKKPPVGGKKQVPSKIATLWKKEDGDSPPPATASRLPVSAAAAKTKRSPPKPSNLPAPSGKPRTNKPPPPKRTDSLATEPVPKEGITKSSTYDKITADLDVGSVPSSDVVDVEDLECDLNTAFQESPSLTQLNNCETTDSILVAVNGINDKSDTTLLYDNSCMSSLSCSVDSLDDISMHSLPVNSGTWKKKRAEGSLTLPNADETCRSVPSSLSTIVNQSCDDSVPGNVWRRYPDEMTSAPTGEPQIWVKRDSKKDGKSKSKNSKKEGKSVAQSIKSTLFGKKQGLSKIFGSQKQGKDKKSKDDAKLTENCRNLLANPKAGTLWQESRTSPSAIVPPFNYSPPAAPKPEQQPVVQNNRSEVTTDIVITDNKRSGLPTLGSKHATKTEMLLARRRQSYLNNSMKMDENSVEDDNKRPCMVTTV